MTRGQLTNLVFAAVFVVFGFWVIVVIVINSLAVATGTVSPREPHGNSGNWTALVVWTIIVLLSARAARRFRKRRSSIKTKVVVAILAGAGLVTAIVSGGDAWAKAVAACVFALAVAAVVLDRMSGVGTPERA